MITVASLPTKWDLADLQAELPRHLQTGSLRYAEFQQLGNGGKAEVFRCHDTVLRRPVAFKVLHHSLMAHSIEQKMLVREARIMAQLDHRSIPAVLDLGRDRHARPYFTMALVEGATLYEKLESLRQGDEQQKQLLTIEQLIAYLLQVGEALEHVHQQGIVHGDLKPENIMIGSDGVVRLLDWGLATLPGHWEHTGNLDGENKPLETQWGLQGSPFYMSPEQVAGEVKLQATSDIYSLGVLLYECLTLQLPLQGESARETMQLVIHTDPVPPSEVTPKHCISSNLEQICLQALAKSSSDRFRSMSEFCERLRDCHLDLLISYERDFG